jgi:hypothetical protein
MSESADYDPGVWRGHDFSSARAAFDRHAGRSYSDAVSAGKSLKDVLPKELSTESPSPLIIVCDVTGSMGEWPKTIFSKLPYLELEGQEYLGKEMEICFAAVGDAYSDKYPVQARPFTKGIDLKERLKELVIEGNGGGQMSETYELAALYLARNVSMPKAITPICIFIGDEMPYDFVNLDHAKNFAYTTLQTKRMSTEAVFAELQEHFSVYLIRKPYGESTRNAVSADDSRIYARWAKILDSERIVDLPDPGRVVDVIFGILAKETDRIDYFKKELKGRQTPKQVETVFKSLETIHIAGSPEPKQLPAGRSVMRKPSGGDKTKSLI